MASNTQSIKGPLEMLRAKNLTLDIGSSKILKDISISIANDELVAIIGPNGAGKSTLLSTLSGAIQPTHGFVDLDGLELQKWPTKELAFRRSILPQQSILNFSFLCFDIVLLGRSPYHHYSTSQEDITAAQIALEKTQTSHLANRSYETLSGGERQRIQLARVLTQINFFDDNYSNKSRFLLLDEPTSDLDLSHQHKILSIARESTERGIGVIAILHDLNLAAMYADKIIVLKNGEITESGAPIEIFSPKMILENFDLNVSIIKHPTRDCPQLIAL